MEWSAFPFFSFLLEGNRGKTTVSDNFPKRLQNRYEISTREKYATHLRWENFNSNWIVIYTILFTIGDFPMHYVLF